MILALFERRRSERSDYNSRGDQKFLICLRVVRQRQLNSANRRPQRLCESAHFWMFTRSQVARHASVKMAASSSQVTSPSCRTMVYGLGSFHIRTDSVAASLARALAAVVVDVQVLSQIRSAHAYTVRRIRVVIITRIHMHVWKVLDRRLYIIDSAGPAVAQTTIFCTCSYVAGLAWSKVEIAQPRASWPWLGAAGPQQGRRLCISRAAACSGHGNARPVHTPLQPA